MGPDLYAVCLQLALHFSALLQLLSKLKVRVGLPTNSRNTIDASISMLMLDRMRIISSENEASKQKRI